MVNVKFGSTRPVASVKWRFIKCHLKMDNNNFVMREIVICYFGEDTCNFLIFEWDLKVKTHNSFHQNHIFSILKFQTSFQR